MEVLRRATARVCRELPGLTGLAGYMLCCVLPCRYCLCGMSLKKPRKKSVSVKSPGGSSLSRSPGGRSPGGRSPGGKQDAALLPPADDEECGLPSKGCVKVLLLGLDGAGKSSFLWFCGNPLDRSLPEGRLPPTAGVQRLTRKDVQLVPLQCSIDLDLSEVGGSKQVRQYWGQYLTPDLAVVAFFVDAGAPERFEEAAAEFAKLCREVLGTRLCLIAVERPPVATGSCCATEALAGVQSFAGSAVDFTRVECSELVLSGPTARGSADALLQFLAARALVRRASRVSR